MGKDFCNKILSLRENYPEIKIRVNTNGHANAVYKTNVVEEFKGLLDEASVSLNSDNSEQYNEICQPKIENAYDAVKDFLKCCKEAGIKTYASIVTGFDDFESNNYLIGMLFWISACTGSPFLTVTNTLP